MGASDRNSFPKFERELRGKHGFVRTSPKERWEGNVADQIAGALQVLTQQTLENLWAIMFTSVEKTGGIVKALRNTDVNLTNKIQSCTVEAACCRLSELTTTLLSHVLQKGLEDLQSPTDDIAAFSRFLNYQGTLRMGGSKIGESDPFSHMMKGFKTGSTESWRMILESCRTHAHQSRSAIDLEALEEVTRNSEPLLLKIASTHLRIFSNFSSTVNNGSAYSLDMNPDPSLFTIEGAAPNRHLQVSPPLMQMVDAQSYTTDEHGYAGCPALFAEGVRRANVIADLYQEMVIPAALHYLKPKLKKG